MIDVVVVGAKGKMGAESVLAIEAEADMSVVAEVDLGDDLGLVLSEKKPSVVLDFTRPDVVKENAQTILKAGVSAVVGTTGLLDSDLSDLDALAKENGVGLLVVPNFAIGAILMMKFAKEAAEYLKKVEIIEYHHDQKLDAPSGTAIKTAKGIEDAGISEVPIHSVRLPGYVAHQEVIFGGLGETLSIRHDSIDRKAFMPGVVLAIRKVGALNGLVYGLEGVL